MRILRIADVPDNRTGGMSRALNFTSDHLRASGHEVDHLFGNDLGAIRENPKFKRFSVPARIPKLVRRMAANGRSYDVVEIHEPSAAVYCGLKRMGLKFPPSVIFSHGLEERGLSSGIAYRRSKGWPVSLKQRTSPYSVVGQAMYAVRHADNVACCSGEDLEYLAARGVPRSRLTQYQNGVSEIFFCGPGVAAKSSDLLYVGSWLERKGVLDLAQAASAVLQKRPRMILTVAGCGVAAQSHVLDDFSPDVRSQLRVIPNVVGEEALADLYRRHGIFILPSIFEGQPLVMLEAAACGLAIVTTNTCGMKDFIQDGVNGKLVPIGNPIVLSEAIEQLSSENDVRARVGRSAQETARRHTWAESARRLAQAYETAIREPLA